MAVPRCRTPGAKTPFSWPSVAITQGSLCVVMAAMRSMIRYKQRESGEWIAVGTDSRSRLVELVYIYDADDDYFFVYHGMTPPSGKTLRELGLER